MCYTGKHSVSRRFLFFLIINKLETGCKYFIFDTSFSQLILQTFFLYNIINSYHSKTNKITVYLYNMEEIKMGILSRFKDIMASNVNAVLDRMEDPSKMVDQLLRDLNDDLGKVKAETAGIMAEEKRAQRELEECKQEVAKLQEYAEKAVMQGNDADAKTFLAKKAQYVEKQTALQQAYDLASANSQKMRQMHDKLVEQINELNGRKDAIKAKMAVAKTQEKINKIGSSISGAQNSLNAFDRMEAKANKMLDTAEAMAELNTNSAEEDLDALKSKYSTDTSGVDDELAALKAKLGK